MASKQRAKSPESTSPTMDSLRRDVADVTDPAEQQVEVWAEPESEPESEPDVAEGVIVDEARRAAEYITKRGYGPNTIELVQYIAANAADTNELNTVIIEQMAVRMLAAEEPDEILDPFGTVKGQLLFDKPLWVTGCVFLEGGYGEGFPWYVSLSVTDQVSGTTQVVTIGGEKLVMQCAAFSMHEAWPQMVAIHQSDKPTKAGFRPLELRRPTP